MWVQRARMRAFPPVMTWVQNWLPAVLVGFAAAVIAACLALLGLLVLRPKLVERHTAGVEPPLRYDATGIETLQAGTAIAIPHNSGDSVAAARRALAHGARAIEIDVALIGEQLRAAHDIPHRLLGDRFTRRPLLGTVWEIAADAELIVLDLKGSSTRFVDALGDFLVERPDAPVVVVGRQPEALHRLREQVHVPLLLSVADHASLRDLLALDAAQVDGISIRHQLLDGELMNLASERGWVVFAWTVDEPARFEHIDRLGVAGVVTDNLAIVEANGAMEVADPLTALLDRETA